MSSTSPGTCDMMTLLLALSQCALGCDRGDLYFYSATYSMPRCQSSRDPSIPTGPHPIIATLRLSKDSAISFCSCLGLLLLQLKIQHMTLDSILTYTINNTQPSNKMQDQQRYKMPVGIVTSELELRSLQKQLLRQQYEKSSYKNIYQPQPSEAKFQQRKFSQRNLLNPEISNGVNLARNDKDQEIKRMLTLQLKSQMEQNYNKKKGQLNKKLEDERALNERNKEIVSKQLETARKIKEKIQQQMSRDYDQRIRRKEQEKNHEQTQKQKIKARLQQIQLSTKKKQKPTTVAQQANFVQMSISAKTPQYYKDVASYQQNNYKNYQQKVKSTTDDQARNYDHLVQERIKENRRREQQFDRYQREQKQSRRQQLQKALEEQMKESERKKLEQRLYEKSKFYGSRFENVYHPICNPIDSRFCKDNKYIIGELAGQAERRRSRESLQTKDSQSNHQEESSLARKGSLSLL